MFTYIFQIQNTSVKKVKSAENVNIW